MTAPMQTGISDERLAELRNALARQRERLQREELPLDEIDDADAALRELQAARLENANMGEALTRQNEKTAKLERELAELRKELEQAHQDWLDKKP